MTAEMIQLRLMVFAGLPALFVMTMGAATLTAGWLERRRAKLAERATGAARQTQERPSRLILEAAHRFLAPGNRTASVSSKTGCCG